MPPKGSNKYSGLKFKFRRATVKVLDTEPTGGYWVLVLETKGSMVRGEVVRVCRETVARAVRLGAVTKLKLWEVNNL